MPPKRKRPERPATDSSGNRPSPHRPENTSLGRHEVPSSEGGGGRGGRGRSTRQSSRRDSLQGQGASGNPLTSQLATSSQSQGPPSPTRQRPASVSSQAAVPPPVNTAFTQAPFNVPTSAPTSPAFPHCAYSIITDAERSRWGKGGRQTVIDHGIQSRNDEDVTEVASIYQELLHSVLDFRLEPTDAGSIVKEIVESDPESVGTSDLFSFDPRVLFLDTVSISVDIETLPYREQLRDFLVATDISPSLMRTVLDPQLMTELGLIRDTFVKIGIRQSTNLLYRQANYNLLREETEGFSKLISELYTNLTIDGPDAEFRWEAAQSTFERVKGLIGTFDLDVGRVLDITLDVFAATIIKQFRPFIKFLRISSWWPRSVAKTEAAAVFGGLPRWARPELAEDATDEQEQEALFKEQRLQRDTEFWNRARKVQLDAFFELGARGVTDAELEALSSGGSETGYDDAQREWIQTTKTLPVRGNRTAAQILGFKLRFYQSDANHKSELLPANLLYLAALLIKIGFVSLTDLYEHLWRPDGEMPAFRDKTMKELNKKRDNDRPSAVANALTMAGALPDDMPPALPAGPARRNDAAAKADEADRVAKEAEAKAKSEAQQEQHDQKVSLLEHLLVIGAIPESLFILGRFPWLIDTHGDKILPLIHRILLFSIDKVYRDSQPVPAKGLTAAASEQCPPKLIADLDQSGARKGTVKASRPSGKRVLRWPHPDKNDVDAGQAYRFYFYEWADNIPICNNVDDFFTLCDTLLNISGVNIGLDSELLAKITSIGKKSLHEDKSEANFARWHDLLKRVLVPALSLTKENSSLVDSVWDLLKLYPIKVRYLIYAEWNQGDISQLPSIQHAFNVADNQTRNVLKRLAATNITSMARSLAKIAYSNPGRVFAEAIPQMESYGNIINAFVECAKYFNDLGYDVLVWSLLSSLGKKDRARVQKGSALYGAMWLQGLSKFSGQAFKRYSNLNSTPVLQFVNERLYGGNTSDLLILMELIISMAGVVSDADFTEAQMLAMSGGTVLRKQTLINGLDKRFEPATQKSAQRLTKALLGGNNLASRLLINIAQTRQLAIYKFPDHKAHIKLMANTIDNTQQALAQYIDLLRTTLEPAQFDATVPGIASLINEFGLDISLAFMIGRGSISFAPNSKALPSPPTASKDDHGSQAPPAPGAAVADADGDVAMASNSSPDVKLPAVSTDAGKTTPDASTESLTPVASNGRKGDPLYDQLQPSIEAVQGLQPAAVWEMVSTELFAIFWSLQLGDIFVPQAGYEAEHNRLKKLAEDVMRDRTDMTKNGMQRKTEQKQNLLEVAKQIRDEMLSQTERNQKLKIRLLKQAGSWFSATAKESAVSDILIEQCLLPRMLLSTSDAEFSYRFLKYLHENRIANFKLMSVLERFLNPNRLRSMIFTCTTREAERLGRFLKSILTDLARWHADKAAYEKEGLGAGKDGRRQYFGFATAIDSDGKPQSFIEHAPFRDLLFSWHKNLNIALRACLKGTEWMHIRNAITVLQSVLEVFPAVNFMGNQFIQQLQAIAEREAAPAKVAPKKSNDEKENEAAAETHRVDLSVAAQTVGSGLQRRKTKWVMVQAFRPNIGGEPQEEPKPVEQKPGLNSKPLRPTAPTFKPGNAPSSTTNRAPATGEVEDGEVKDPKSAVSTGGPSKVTTAPSPASGPGPLASSTSSTTEKGLPNLPSRAPLADKDVTRKDGNATVPNAPSTPSKPPPVRPTGAPSTIPSAPARPDPPKTSTLPAVHGLPKRPDVGFPVGGRVSHDRREPSSRDSREQRDPVRGPRESRDHREPRDGREPRDARDPRDPRDQRDPREHRTPEAARLERPARDLPAAPDRRGPEGISREPGRPSERDWNSRPEPPRWAGGDHPMPDRDSRSAREQPREPLRDVTPREAPRDSPRDAPRERSHGHGPAAPGGPRGHEGRVGPRDSRDGPRESPREGPRDGARDIARDGPSSGKSSLPAPPAPEPTINPERAKLLAADRPDMFPPERPGAPSRDDGRSRLPARTESPRNNERFNIESVVSSDRLDRPRDRERERDRERDRERTERDGRHNRASHHADNGPSNRDSHGGEQQAHPPSRDRHADRDGDRGRDAFQGGSRQSLDQDHGRMSHQDPNYGRLNPIQSVADIPSGPRGRGRDLASRSSSLNLNGPLPPPPPARGDGRFSSGGDGQRAPSPERHPPTGPSSNRSSRRGRSGQHDTAGSNIAPPPPPTNPVGPSSTATTGGAAGVHPDRIARINGPTGPASGLGGGPISGSSQGPVNANSIPINPDRMNQIKAPPPPSHPSASTTTPMPGSGSRSSLPGPTHQTPDRPPMSGSGFTANSGSSSANDRSKPRVRPPIDGINTMLEKAGMESRSSLPDSGGRSAGYRRGGGRTSSLADSDARVLTGGGSPVTTPIHDRSDPMGRGPPSLGDVNSLPPHPLRGEGRGGGGGGGSGPGNEQAPSSGGRDHERSSRREHRERGSRPSRRSSRERSPDRGDRGEPKDHREYRDRRSGVASNSAGTGSGSGGHGRESGRDGDRDSLPPPRSGSGRSGRDSTGGNGLNSGNGGREREALAPTSGGSSRESRHRAEGRHEGSGRGDPNASGGNGGNGGDWPGSGGGGHSRGGGGRNGGGGGGGGGGGSRVGGDDRRDGGNGGSSRDDRGRKRRSEDGLGSLSNDREKRQRR